VEWGEERFDYAPAHQYRLMKLAILPTCALVGRALRLRTWALAISMAAFLVAVAAALLR